MYRLMMGILIVHLCNVSWLQEWHVGLAHRSSSLKILSISVYYISAYSVRPSHYLSGVFIDLNIFSFLRSLQLLFRLEWQGLFLLGCISRFSLSLDSWFR
jgi:hypothetical protein